MTCCLVTGGPGFIGSHLVEALLNRGDKVRVLDNFSTGDPANLTSVREEVEVIEGDLTDLETVRRSVRGVEVVFHQAALASVPRSVADPLATHAACVNGTLNVLSGRPGRGRPPGRLRRQLQRLRRPRPDCPRARPTRPCRCRPTPSPSWPASSTAQPSARSTVWRRCGSATSTSSARGSRRTAPTRRSSRCSCGRCSAGRRRSIHGDGQQSRDFTFIDDVIQANLLAAEVPGVSGRVYNIACGKRTSLLELVEKINGLLGTNILPSYRDPRAGDVRHSQADIARATAELGYRPRNDIDRGLRRCLEHSARPSSIARTKPQGCSPRPPEQEGLNLLNSRGPTLGDVKRDVRLLDEINLADNPGLPVEFASNVSWDLQTPWDQPIRHVGPGSRLNRAAEFCRRCRLSPLVWLVTLLDTFRPAFRLWWFSRAPRRWSF